MRTTHTATGTDRKPFDPKTKAFKADHGTLETVRKYGIGDWDGTNWEAVRALLRNRGMSSKEIATMTEFQIRMRIATYCNTCELLVSAIWAAIGERKKTGVTDEDMIESIMRDLTPSKAIVSMLIERFKKDQL